jgi:hypothetical protein
MMRFHIDACPPRQPQTKGKVERRKRPVNPSSLELSAQG